MKKFVLCASLLALVVAIASPVLAWDTAKQEDLKRDKNNMQWYILDYGTDDKGIIFAESRKYYTNQTIKNETIDLLMTKFGIPAAKAGELAFTEYRYEYTEDGKEFAVAYQRHYNLGGDEIHGTVFDDSSDATKKTYIALSSVAGSTPAIAAQRIFGKSAGSTKKAASTSTKKSSTVPAKRVVRAKKK